MITQSTIISDPYESKIDVDPTKGVEDYLDINLWIYNIVLL